MTKYDLPLDEDPTAQVTAVINQMVPVGTIISYGGKADSFPPGWLPCDGSTFDQDQYPDLYVALGNTNTVPDLGGYFLRGLDPSGKVDPDGAGRDTLSVQEDEFAGHTHDIQSMATYGNDPYKGGDPPGVPWCEDLAGAQTTTNTGGNETRPKNVAVLYLIFAGLPQQ